MRQVVSFVVLFLGTFLFSFMAQAGPSCYYEKIEDSDFSRVFCQVKPSGNWVNISTTDPTDKNAKKLEKQVANTHVSYKGRSYTVPCPVASVAKASKPWIYEVWKECFVKNASLPDEEIVDFSDESQWTADGVSFEKDVKMGNFTVPKAALKDNTEGLACSWGSYGPASNFETEKGYVCGGEQLATGEVECTDPETDLKFQTVVACPQTSAGDPTACFRSALNEKKTKDVESEKGQK
jgi:hypothetical protein